MRRNPLPKSKDNEPIEFIDQVNRNDDLSGEDLRNANLKGSDFTGCSFHNANLTGANLRDCNFTDCDFTGAILDYAILAGADVSGAYFNRVSVKGTILFDIEKLLGCVFTPVNYEKLGGFVINLEIPTRLEDPRRKSKDRLEIMSFVFTFFNFNRRFTYAFALPVDKVLETKDFTYCFCDTEEFPIPKNLFVGADLRDNDFYAKGSGFRGFNFTGFNFTGADLTGAILRHCNLTNCDFTNAVLDKSSLADAKVDGAVFDKCSVYRTMFCELENLQKAKLFNPLNFVEIAGYSATHYSKYWARQEEEDELREFCLNNDLSYPGVKTVLQERMYNPHYEAEYEEYGEEAEFTYVERGFAICNSAYLNLSYSFFVHTTFLNQGILNYAKFIHTDLSKARLPIDLESADFSHAILTEADLDRCNLKNANFEKASCKRASFIQSNLFNADFTRANLGDTNFQGAKLQSANLENASLDYADLTRADLTGANLNGTGFMAATLVDATLVDADLEDAHLYDASLNGANCEGANFKNAYLFETLTTGTNFKNANLEDIVTENEAAPEFKDAAYFSFITLIEYLENED